MSPKPRPLRRRLAAWLVGMAVGSLVLAVAVTAGLARSTARHDAERDLLDAADGITRLAGAEGLATLSKRLSRVLDVDDIVIVDVAPGGEVLPRLNAAAGRAGLPLSAIDGEKLLAGQSTSGSSGRTVFAAQPLPDAFRRKLTRLQAGQPALVLTRQVAAFPLGRSGSYLLVAAGLTAAAAAGVAMWLSRRLVRPLQAMEATTRAIAAGDLGARVEKGMAGADDELAALAAGIDSMAAQLSEARQLERGFLMSVSHDLRTPLTSIRGYAEAIGDGAVTGPEDLARAAGIIGAESRRLERLVGDLLDLARLDSREFALRPRPADAAEVVAGIVDGLQPAAAEAGLTLRLEHHGPVAATIDPERLGQVVANLVENALKYARTSVDVAVQSGVGGRVEIAVTDDGPGIAAEDLPKVFDRLYTSRGQAGRKVGTGLGLAIVRELTAAMGGSVTASAGAGGGTHFVVSVSGR